MINFDFFFHFRDFLPELQASMTSYEDMAQCFISHVSIAWNDDVTILVPFNQLHANIYKMQF